ncbi:MAG: LuxR C-terminal-related transcriptional regulator [Dehalococcoidia bacterium]
MAQRGRPRHLGLLTPREQAVLARIRLGRTNPEIAAELGITVETVKQHVSEVLSKLGVGTREEAAVWQPEPPGHWTFGRALLALAGVSIVAAAVAGLALLSWGVSESGAEDIEPGWPDCKPVDANALESGLYLLDGRTCETTELAPNKADSLVAWNADDTRIAYTNVVPTPESENNTEIFVMDVESGDVRQVTDSPSTIEGQPYWMPDGGLVYLAAEVDPVNPLGVIAEDDWPLDLVLTTSAGQTRVITSGLTCAYDMDVAPSGKYVAMLAGCALREDNLILVDVGTGERTSIGERAGWPRFAPNNDRLAFECRRGEGLEGQAVCLRSTSGEIMTMTLDLFSTSDAAGAGGSYIEAGRPIWSQADGSLTFFGEAVYTLPPKGSGTVHEPASGRWPPGQVNWHSGDVVAGAKCVEQGIAPCPTIHFNSYRLSDGDERTVMITTDCGAIGYWSRDGQMLTISVPEATVCY